MIRVGQIIEDIDSAHGGTSSAFLEIVSALSSLRDRATVVAYCGRPPEGDAVLKRRERGRCDAQGRHESRGSLARPLLHLVQDLADAGKPVLGVQDAELHRTRDGCQESCSVGRGSRIRRIGGLRLA